MHNYYCLYNYIKIKQLTILRINKIKQNPFENVYVTSYIWSTYHVTMPTNNMQSYASTDDDYFMTTL